MTGRRVLRRWACVESGGGGAKGACSERAPAPIVLGAERNYWRCRCQRNSPLEMDQAATYCVPEVVWLHRRPLIVRVGILVWFI